MANILLGIFIIIRILSNPAAGVLQKKLSLNFNAYIINLYSYFFLSMFCLFNFGCLKNFRFTPEFIILTIVCGLLCTAGMICMIKAINIGELSVLGPINSYKSILGLIIAVFLLKEIPSVFGIIGMILIVWGSKYILSSPDESLSFKILKRKDIQLRFLAMTLTAAEAVFLKKIILISSVEICFMFWCFTGLFWNLLFYTLHGKNSPNQNIRDFKSYLYLLLIACCLGLMQYSTNYVFERMNVGYALALFQLSAIVTVIFGSKFFNEKNILSKTIGSIIMITGSWFIILG